MATPTGILFNDPRAKPTSAAGIAQPGAYYQYYLTQTTAPATVYKDGALTIPAVQTPTTGDTTLAGDGRLIPIYLNPNVIYRVQLYSAIGALLEDTDPYVVPLGGPLYPQTAAEQAAGVTPTNFGYPFGDIRRYGGVCDSGTTDNKTPLQNALNACAGYTPVTIPSVSGQYYKVGDRVTCPAHTAIVGLDFPSLKWSAITTNGATIGGVASLPAIEAQGDDFSIVGCSLFGPSGAGVFKSGETGILRVGTSASARGLKWRVENCEIQGFGQYAVATQFMQNIYVRYNKIHDCGYSGGTHLSPLMALHEYNEIYNITPGSGGNCYGDNFTHNSLNYNVDPLVGSVITAITNAASAVVTINTVSGSNPFAVGMDVSFFSVVGMTQINGLKGAVTAIGGSSGAWTITVAINSSGFGAYVSGGLISCPRQATNPFPIACITRNNFIHDIPLWGAIDFHGAYDCVAEKNEIYNCYIGVQLSGSSGNGANYAGENNSVLDNAIFYDQANGNASAVNATRGSPIAFAVITNGGSVTPHRNVRVSGNKAYGAFGDPVGFSGSAFVFQMQFCRKLVCDGNTLIGFNGIGLYVAQSDGVLNNNAFGWVSTAANSGCIYAAGNCDISAVGNRHTTEGLTAASFGMNCNISGMTRMLVINDFFEATAPYGNGMALLTRGNSDLPPRFTDTTTGAHTFDVSPAGNAPLVWLQYNGGGVGNITDLTGMNIGSTLVIENNSASALTITSGTPFKFSAASPVINQNGTLTLTCIAVANPKLTELTRSLTNAA